MRSTTSTTALPYDRNACGVRTAGARDGSAADSAALAARLLAARRAVLEPGEPVAARRGHWGPRSWTMKRREEESNKRDGRTDITGIL